MAETIISIGTLVGLSKANNNHKVGVYIGNDNIVLVYEYGTDIYPSFNLVEKNIDSLKDFETSNDHVRNLNELKNDSFKISVSSLNIFDFKLKSKDFFEIMRHNFNEINKLEIGDVIFFNRTFYNHAGLMENLESLGIIHKNSKNDLKKVIKNQLLNAGGDDVDKAGEIRRNYLLDVIKMSKINRFNFYDKENRPFLAAEIIERAVKSLGDEDYDLKDGNCQHYCFKIRNNVARSPAVEKAKNLLKETDGLDKAIIIAIDILEKHLKKELELEGKNKVN